MTLYLGIGELLHGTRKWQASCGIKHSCGRRGYQPTTLGCCEVEISDSPAAMAHIAECCLHLGYLPLQVCGAKTSGSTA